MYWCAVGPKAGSGSSARRACQIGGSLKKQLDAETYAFDIQSGSDPDSPMLHRIGADAWFDRTSADRLEVQEQTVRISSNETLTLLVICDGEILEE